MRVQDVSACRAERLFALSQETGYVFDLELLVLAQQLGYRVAEVGVNWVRDARQQIAHDPRVAHDLGGRLANPAAEHGGVTGSDVQNSILAEQRRSTWSGFASPKLNSVRLSPAPIARGVWRSASSLDASAPFSFSPAVLRPWSRGRQFRAAGRVVQPPHQAEIEFAAADVQ